MNTLYEKPKRPNTFGYIALAISAGLFFTPRFMLPMVCAIMAVFVLIALFHDGNKLAGIGAVVIALLFVYLIADQRLDELTKDSSPYTVRYEVECEQCNVSYTNYTGGTDNERDVRGKWSRSVELKGDEFVYLNAQNSAGSTYAHASIWVNGEILKGESGSGQYSSASVSCQPKDLYNK